MTDRVAMAGFNKVRPISEGYVVKGGVNSTSRIEVRPPAPAPMRPAKAAPAPAPASQSK
jgi:hypothetical protein